jgi:hypothetical protein
LESHLNLLWILFYLKTNTLILSANKNVIKLVLTIERSCRAGGKISCQIEKYQNDLIIKSCDSFVGFFVQKHILELRCERIYTSD